MPATYPATKLAHFYSNVKANKNEDFFLNKSSVS